MSVDRGISSGSREILVLPVWDMEVGLWIPVLLRETEVDDVDLVASLSDAHEEIVGLDVPVDEGFGVNVLDPGDLSHVSHFRPKYLQGMRGGISYELVCKQEDCLEGKLAVAEVE